MNAMKTPRFLVITTLAAAAVAILGFRETARGRDISIADNSVAAIAYSPATGKYGIAYNCPDKASAEKSAIADCGADDALLACWVEKGFCALALGADKSCWGAGWSYGDGASTNAARQFALDDCRTRTTGAHIETYLSSDGQVLWKRSLKPGGGGQIWVSPDTFAAVAYSPATGRYGIAYDRLSRKSAEKEALSKCAGEDARIVCWVNKGFCALALGHDKAHWGSGWSDENDTKAKQAALADYQAKTSGAAHIEVSMSSDGQILWEQSKHKTIILPTGEVILPSGERILPSEPKPSIEGATTRTMTEEETFKWYDAKGDGFLTREEFLARPTNPTTPRAVWERVVEGFMRKDTNGDGKLSQEEWKTPPPPRKEPGAEKNP